MYSSTHSLTSALDGGEWSASRPCRFTPTERAPGTHWTGGWVVPRAVLDAVMKRKIPSPHRESNPRTPIVQPVAQRYTDWAITALFNVGTSRKIFHNTNSSYLWFSSQARNLFCMYTEWCTFSVFSLFLSPPPLPSPPPPSSRCLYLLRACVSEWVTGMFFVRWIPWNTVRKKLPNGLMAKCCCPVSLPP
jgi:hypothetical protein